MTTQEIVNATMKAMSSFLDKKFDSFAKELNERNSATIGNSVKKAKRETFTCQKKGNQQQYDHCQQVLEKFDESLEHLNSGSEENLK